ncbi:hypothetical protein ThrDRAFT_01951 [Frankia casuarinae]|jgi:hypothetical protein|uniref:Uncharacterized protein n=1 Tax=Frankia casuarinae (strain DSM 45818 / CECT 9043 / HFP020203 / CcI3) TaxID=106370 RepID=Q2JCL9_FRACC|nr:MULTISPECIES: hypothetical protein [Frankia]ABD10973.1 hypothetical protein Francci3_1597 [Frankia casuarinae]ETA02175.1 hypothetical protein CcI6DRAFT_02350 [Frankia sp. CcI6]EYT92341.1 hypothetical protein ThrDRAFT_01951 [Frankia casuarinae]KDA42858.1 hypothetical protein BMG523Draft_02247 [Frankia sp. BMG5.23]KEZ37509.1 hypothetical protein CEDDRAFT_01136 [Frankia sp. CeD]
MNDITGNCAGELNGELFLEWAELLPERTTLAAVEIGRKEFDPTFFPVGSPWSKMAQIDAHAEPQVAGGFLPILITLVPSINIIIQK